MPVTLLTVDAATVEKYRRAARVVDAQLAVTEHRLAELRANRENLMRKMRDEGGTLQQVGDAFGVARQRVYQMLKQPA